MKLVYCIILVTAAMVFGGCSKSRSPEGEPSGTVAPAATPDGEPLGTETPAAPPEGEPSGTVAGKAAVALCTMGKVVAGCHADLSFEAALPVMRVCVKNGEHVRCGQLLASQDAYVLRNAVEQQRLAVEQARLQIEQARLQMQDVIIAQGYDPDGAVPENVRHIADIKAGYALAQSRLAAAETLLEAERHKLASATLTAPFDGIVANLAVQPHQLVAAGVAVCRIIAIDEMKVEFRVMETDLTHYPMNTRVVVVPVADKTHCHEAVVSEINPVVDAQGAVTLRARLANGADLFDGMNVELRRIED
ncbi:MAG: efflux RND transporter periplasmic adaptor subunit [Prevotella sp.]